MCGNIKTDNVTLLWDKNCLTTPNSVDIKPIFVHTSCGGMYIDSNHFKIIDKCITSINATETVNPIKICGMVNLDGNFFVKLNHSFGYHE